MILPTSLHVLRVPFLLQKKDHRTAVIRNQMLSTLPTHVKPRALHSRKLFGAGKTDPKNSWKCSNNPTGNPKNMPTKKATKKVFSSSLVYFTGPICMFSSQRALIESEIAYHNCVVNKVKRYACYIKKVETSSPHRVKRVTDCPGYSAANGGQEGQRFQKVNC